MSYVDWLSMLSRNTRCIKMRSSSLPYVRIVKYVMHLVLVLLANGEVGVTTRLPYKDAHYFPDAQVRNFILQNFLYRSLTLFKCSKQYSNLVQVIVYLALPWGMSSQEHSLTTVILPWTLAHCRFCYVFYRKPDRHHFSTGYTRNIAAYSMHLMSMLLVWSYSRTPLFLLNCRSFKYSAWDTCLLIFMKK